MSDQLKASIDIRPHELMSMPDHELDILVKRKLAEQFRETLMQKIDKNMKVTSQYNPLTDTTSYTGSFTASSFNGTSYVEKAEDLRVVEFTKNGKVARVELQRKTEHGWKKIPRIQIEE